MNRPIRFSLLLPLLLTGMVACGPAASDEAAPPAFQAGRWRFALQLKPELELPFIATVDSSASGYRMTIHNAEERITVDEVEQVGDSVFMRLPVFDSEFRGQLLSNRKLRGQWHDYSRGGDYAIPFVAEAGDAPRFAAEDAAPADLAERYAVGFSVGTPDAYPAIGMFDQKGTAVSGSFLTETGDYRFLEGGVQGKHLQLSAFDGSHAFLFVADARGDTLRGTFYSGNHWQEPWMAVPSAEAELRDPDELTYLREGYETLDFTFANQAGDSVSLSDERFQGKVVIVQLMGSWCPNCMDETRLYADWYQRYQDQGLEIIGLAFEREKDRAKAWRNIERMKTDLGAEYDVLLAATTNDKVVAGQVLPALNQVMSYPTSIYIDRQGRIRKIHTGFHGPGAGAPYERFVEQYSDFIEAMLAEKG